MSEYFNAYLPHLTAEGREVSPYNTKVLVVVDERPETTKSGLVRTDYNASDRGVVKAIGEKVTAVQPGDRVVYSWRKGDDFVVDGEHWLFLEEHELLATISEAEGPGW